jgi:hypothetical protein
MIGSDKVKRALPHSFEEASLESLSARRSRSLAGKRTGELPREFQS